MNHRGGRDMAVLERSELEASPLADLHAIADQIGLDGFRRLRKAELIDAILTRTGDGDGLPAQERADGGTGAGEEGAASDRPASRRRRTSRARRARPTEDEDHEGDSAATGAAAEREPQES